MYNPFDIHGAVGKITAGKIGVNPFVKKSSTSWADFYFNMAVDMLEATLIRKAVDLAEPVIAQMFQNSGLSGEDIENLIGNIFFAKSLADEYHEVIEHGRTLIGGIPFKGGNKNLMFLHLVQILNHQKFSKTLSLLERIGPAVQTYWIGATHSVSPIPNSQPAPVPNIPCIGAAVNLTTTIGMNFAPGIWSPIPCLPSGEPFPWLLNFIISANLHLLTVGGMIFCNCQYPPPAPPAPGVLPFVGYITNPLSTGVLRSQGWKGMVRLAGVTAAQVAVVGTERIASIIVEQAGKEEISFASIKERLVDGFIGVEDDPNATPEQKEGIKAIIEGDPERMKAAGEALKNAPQKA